MFTFTHTSRYMPSSGESFGWTEKISQEPLKNNRITIRIPEVKDKDTRDSFIRSLPGIKEIFRNRQCYVWETYHAPKDASIASDDDYFEELIVEKGNKKSWSGWIYNMKDRLGYYGEEILSY